MQLYYIRHAQSENNLLWDRTGDNLGRSHDPQLTETGKRQAETLAQFLAGCTSRPLDRAKLGDAANDPQNALGFGLTHIYTSLMLRAVATGTAVANALNLPLVAWPDLHEGGGIYLEDEESGLLVGLPGNPRSYFEQHYPNLVLPDSLGESGWWNRPFEERPDRRRRAWRVWKELLQRHGETDDRVALISHGGFYNHLLSIILHYGSGDKQTPEMPDDLALTQETHPGAWFAMNNTAISRMDFTPREVRLVYSNRIDFLPYELVT
jgi:2,3-bisphosphoglycerate-dependent phosphoglycerate mutase